MSTPVEDKPALLAHNRLCTVWWLVYYAMKADRINTYNGWLGRKSVGAGPYLLNLVWPTLQHQRHQRHSHLRFRRAGIRGGAWRKYAMGVFFVRGVLREATAEILATAGEALKFLLKAEIKNEKTKFNAMRMHSCCINYTGIGQTHWQTIDMSHILGTNSHDGFARGPLHHDVMRMVNVQVIFLPGRFFHSEVQFYSFPLEKGNPKYHSRCPVKNEKEPLTKMYTINQSINRILLKQANTHSINQSTEQAIHHSLLPLSCGLPGTRQSHSPDCQCKFQWAWSVTRVYCNAAPLDFSAQSDGPVRPAQPLPTLWQRQYEIHGWWSTRAMCW